MGTPDPPAGARDPRDLFRDAKTLDAVVRTAARARPPWRLADIVVQDEYTHDVVMRSGEHWAVLDVT